MTESDIQCLKDNVEKKVEIETSEGEQLIAKVLVVIYDKEYDEHELIYEVVSSNKLESYSHLDDAGGYVLDFNKIVSVKPMRFNPSA
jgi:hypothetical protein